MKEIPSTSMALFMVLHSLTDGDSCVIEDPEGFCDHTGFSFSSFRKRLDELKSLELISYRSRKHVIEIQFLESPFHLFGSASKFVRREKPCRERSPFTISDDDSAPVSSGSEPDGESKSSVEQIAPASSNGESRDKASTDTDKSGGPAAKKRSRKASGKKPSSKRASKVGTRKSGLNDQDIEWVTSSADNMSLYVRFGKDAVGHDQNYCIDNLESTPNDFVRHEFHNITAPQLAAAYWVFVSYGVENRGGKVSIPDWGRLAKEAARLLESMTISDAHHYMCVLVTGFDVVRERVGKGIGINLRLDDLSTLNHAAIKNVVLQLSEQVKARGRSHNDAWAWLMRMNEESINKLSYNHRDNLPTF